MGRIIGRVMGRIIRRVMGRGVGFALIIRLRKGFGRTPAAGRVLLQTLQAEDRGIEISQLKPKLGEHFTQIHGDVTEDTLFPSLIPIGKSLGKGPDEDRPGAARSSAGR